MLLEPVRIKYSILRNIDQLVGAWREGQLKQIAYKNIFLLTLLVTEENVFSLTLLVM